MHDTQCTELLLNHAYPIPKRYLPLYSLLKVLGWVIIVSMNLFCISYVLLFAIQASDEMQRGWFGSFVLWLITDLVFASTGVVVYQQGTPPPALMHTPYCTLLNTCSCICIDISNSLLPILTYYSTPTLPFTQLSTPLSTPLSTLLSTSLF